MDVLSSLRKKMMTHSKAFFKYVKKQALTCLALLLEGNVYRAKSRVILLPVL